MCPPEVFAKRRRRWSGPVQVRTRNLKVGRGSKVIQPSAVEKGRLTMQEPAQTKVRLSDLKHRFEVSFRIRPIYGEVTKHGLVVGCDVELVGYHHGCRQACERRLSRVRGGPAFPSRTPRPYPFRTPIREASPSWLRKSHSSRFDWRGLARGGAGREDCAPTSSLWRIRQLVCEGVVCSPGRATESGRPRDFV